MKVRDLRVLKKHFDPAIDGYLVLGRRKQGAARPYVVGWHSRHKDTRFVSRKSFSTIAKAKEHFNEAARGESTPVHKTFLRDWQDNDVYLWEEGCLQDKAATITQEQAAALIQTVSKDYGIEPPALVWLKRNTKRSSFLESENRIKFGHRDNIALLHELGHAIQCHYRDRESDHGPPFVWIAIELYHRYAGLNLPYLVATAKQKGLLGDIDRQMLENVKGYAKTPSLKLHQP